MKSSRAILDRIGCRGGGEKDARSRAKEARADPLCVWLRFYVGLYVGVVLETFVILDVVGCWMLGCWM